MSYYHKVEVMVVDDYKGAETITIECINYSTQFTEVMTIDEYEGTEVVTIGIRAVDPRMRGDGFDAGEFLLRSKINEFLLKQQEAQRVKEIEADDNIVDGEFQKHTVEERVLVDFIDAEDKRHRETTREVLGAEEYQLFDKIPEPKNMVKVDLTLNSDTNCASNNNIFSGKDVLVEFLGHEGWKKNEHTFCIETPKLTKFLPSKIRVPSIFALNQLSVKKVEAEFKFQQRNQCTSSLSLRPKYPKLDKMRLMEAGELSSIDARPPGRPPDSDSLPPTEVANGWCFSATACSIHLESPDLSVAAINKDKVPPYRLPIIDVMVTTIANMGIISAFVELLDYEPLIKYASTVLDLNMVVYFIFLVPLADDDEFSTVEHVNSDLVDLKGVGIVWEPTEAVENSEWIAGLAFSMGVIPSMEWPIRVENAKISMVEFHIPLSKVVKEQIIGISIDEFLWRTWETEEVYIVGCDGSVPVQLQDHHHKLGNPPLPWKKHLHVCVGAVTGLLWLCIHFHCDLIRSIFESTARVPNENSGADTIDFGVSKIINTFLVFEILRQLDWVIVSCGNLQKRHAFYEVFHLCKKLRLDGGVTRLVCFQTTNAKLLYFHYKSVWEDLKSVNAGATLGFIFQMGNPVFGGKDLNALNNSFGIIEMAIYEKLMNVLVQTVLHIPLKVSNYNLQLLFNELKATVKCQIIRATR